MKIDEQTLKDLSVGATVLGSGGGGYPGYDLLMAKKALEDYGPPELVALEDLQEEAMVLPIAFVGAPLVNLEILPSGNELDSLINQAERVTGKRITHLMAAEIGGANALAPFLYASKRKLPIVDADTIGRAFPELQMSACNVRGVSASPAFLVDILGNTVCIEANDADTLEKFARKVIVEMGSTALMGIYLMNGAQAKKTCIKGSISYACQIGKRLREAYKEKKTSRELLQEIGGKVIGEGVIESINQSVQDGFLKGTVHISSPKETLVLNYQNEFLQVLSSIGKVFTTPDIITVFEKDTLKPITSECLLYGARVEIAVLNGPDIWKEEKGLALVGPSAFGLTL